MNLEALKLRSNITLIASALSLGGALILIDPEWTWQNVGGAVLGSLYVWLTSRTNAFDILYDFHKENK